MGNNASDNVELLTAINALSNRLGDRAFPALAECVGSLAALVAQPKPAPQASPSQPRHKPVTKRNTAKGGFSYDRGVLIDEAMMRRIKAQIDRDGTTTKFAERAGISRPQMSRILKPGVRVMPATIKRLKSAMVGRSDDPYEEIASDAPTATTF